MRILVANDKGWFAGGVEQFVDDVTAGLSARGHRVHLLSTEPVGAGREPLRGPFAGQTRLILDASEGSWRRQLEFALEEAAPDVVLLNRFPGGPALEALCAGRRVVRYVHDHDLYCPRRHKYFPVSRHICDRPLGAACVLHGCLVTPVGPVAGLPGLIDLRVKARDLAFSRRLPLHLVGSKWMHGALVRNGFPADRVEILPPVPAGLERAPAPPGREPLVLYVGSVIRGKGVDQLLRALALVRCPYRALVIGTGNMLRECVDLARTLGVADRVSFVGWVRHDRLAAYYDQARVVAVPSRWAEPFGMVGLEAMWAGRPAVAFGVGGIPDWLADRETGVLVPERDVRAFAHALEELLDNPALGARMGTAGFERAAREFRHGAFLDRLEATLERVAGAPAPAA